MIGGGVAAKPVVAARHTIHKNILIWPILRFELRTETIIVVQMAPAIRVVFSGRGSK